MFIGQHTRTQVAGQTPFDKQGGPFTSDDLQGTTIECARREILRYFASSPNVTTTTLSNSGNLLLERLSTSTHWLTGIGTDYTVTLPDATELESGHKYEIWNMSDYVVTVKNKAGIILFLLGQYSYASIQLESNGSIGGVWRYWQILASSVASGIINYYEVQSALFQTTMTTYAEITDFNVLPQAGTYAIWGNMDINIVQNNQKAQFSIFKDSTQLLDSERAEQGTGSNYECGTSNMTVTSVTGSEVISGRVRITSGTLDVYGRSLLLIRLGT